LAAISAEEVFLDALVSVTNHSQSGETPDSPQWVHAVEAIRVKSSIIVSNSPSNVNHMSLLGESRKVGIAEVGGIGHLQFEGEDLSAAWAAYTIYLLYGWVCAGVETPASLRTNPAKSPWRKSAGFGNCNLETKI
jgi:hypothetical protein